MYDCAGRNRSASARRNQAGDGKTMSGFQPPLLKAMVAKAGSAPAPGTWSLGPTRVLECAPEQRTTEEVFMLRNGETSRGGRKAAPAVDNRGLAAIFSLPVERGKGPARHGDDLMSLRPRQGRRQSCDVRHGL